MSKSYATVFFLISKLRWGKKSSFNFLSKILKIRSIANHYEQIKTIVSKVS